MDTRDRLFATGLLMLAATGAGADPQHLDEPLLARYGGTYLADCADSTSGRAAVFADSLVLACGGRRVVGRDPQPAYAWFGNAPPEGFALALLATAPGGRELTWLVWDGPGGRHLTVDDDVADDIATDGLTFSHCDTARAEVAAPAAAGRTYALDELSAPGLLFDDGAKAAYYSVLGPLRDEPWLADLDGPSPQNRRVNVGGLEFVLICACKNHDCWDNNVVLLYRQVDSIVYGMVYRSGRTTMLGMPSPEIAQELDRLWREEFRQQQP